MYAKEKLTSIICNIDVLLGGNYDSPVSPVGIAFCKKFTALIYG